MTVSFCARALQIMRTVLAASSLLGLAAPALAFLRAPALQRVSTLGSTASTSRRGCVTMARRPFIAGNWKLNPGSMDEAVTLAKAVSNYLLI